MFARKSRQEENALGSKKVDGFAFLSFQKLARIWFPIGRRIVVRTKR